MKALRAFGYLSDKAKKLMFIATIRLLKKSNFSKWAIFVQFVSTALSGWATHAVRQF